MILPNSDMYIALNDSDNEDDGQFVDTELARVEITGIELLERQSRRRGEFLSDSDSSSDTTYDFDLEWASLQGEHCSIDGDERRQDNLPRGRRSRTARVASDSTEVDSLVLARTRIGGTARRRRTHNGRVDASDEDSIVLARRRMPERAVRRRRFSTSNETRQAAANDDDSEEMIVSLDAESVQSCYDEGFTLGEARTVPLKDEPEPRRLNSRSRRTNRRRFPTRRRPRSHRFVPDPKDLRRVDNNL